MNTADNAQISQSFDISAYIATNTQIRFIGSGKASGNTVHIYFDNIQIEYSTTPSATPNHYLNTTNTQPVWDMGRQGQGVAVAVIDSGISPSADFGDHLVAQVSFNTDAQTANDRYGNGTHVAGIIGGNGVRAIGYLM